MTKSRLEAFSDGVIAIIITIAVLELKRPSGHDWSALSPMIPIISSYTLSFIYLGIYWNNHHHLLQASKHVTGAVLWANLHLLFWLSLVPFATGWMGESGFAKAPVAAYGAILLLCGFAYSLLVKALIKAQGTDSHLSKAIGKDLKGNLSVCLYVLAIPLAMASPVVACVIYATVALIWLIPDKRIESTLELQDKFQ